MSEGNPNLKQSKKKSLKLGKKDPRCYLTTAERRSEGGKKIHRPPRETKNSSTANGINPLRSFESRNGLAIAPKVARKYKEERVKGRNGRVMGNDEGKLKSILSHP